MLSRVKSTAKMFANELSEESELKKELAQLGIIVDSEGHLFYSSEFKPLELNYELVFVRHGETYGNCGQSTLQGTIDEELVKQSIKDKEKRIYQGNIDGEINQLTSLGRQQALDAAKNLKLELLDRGWIPDKIYVSPLKRAQDTAAPFIKENNLQHLCQIHAGITEMSFGILENKRVCDIASSDESHSFYQNQNALMKKIDDANFSENFCEVLLRARDVLLQLNRFHSGEKIMFFSHSMFGGTCQILLGKGQKIENGHYLAFDGKRPDGSYYTMPNATPILLNFRLDAPKKVSKV